MGSSSSSTTSESFVNEGVDAGVHKIINNIESPGVVDINEVGST